MKSTTFLGNFPKLDSSSKTSSFFYEPPLNKSQTNPILYKPRVKSFHLDYNQANNTQKTWFNKPNNSKTTSFFQNTNENYPSDPQILDRVNKKRSNLIKKQQKLEFFLKSSKNLDKFSSYYQHLSLILNKLSSDLYDKFLLLPVVESPILEKFLDFQSSFLHIFSQISVELLYSKKIQSKHPNYIEDPLPPILDSSNINILSGSNDNTHVSSGKTSLPEVTLLRFENIRLEAMVKDLRKLLILQEQPGHEATIQRRYEQMIVEAEEKRKEIEEKTHDFDKVLVTKQQSLNNYKQLLSKFEQENENLRKTSSSIEIQMSEISASMEALRQEKEKHREIGLMQYEEAYQLNYKINELSLFSQKLKERIIYLNDKVVKLTGTRIENPENPEEKNFFHEFSFFSIVNQHFSEKGFKRPKDGVFIKTLNQEEIAKNKEKLNRIANRSSVHEENSPDLRSANKGSDKFNEEITKKLEEFDFSKYSLTKPSFFSLIEHKFMSYSSEIHAERPNKISTSFLATIRGIFDSKYNEFMLTRDWRMISKFPEFVYSWLGKFQLSLKNQRIEPVPKKEQSNADDVRIVFLIDLTNPKLRKLWEIVTFKDFFEEKSQLDELYFYLHCRNLLFQGPELSSSKSFFDVIHYVSIEKCYDLIDIILQNFDKISQNFLKKKIKEKAGKVTINGLLIDSSYVLRLLLEYYKAEKFERIRLFRDLFLSQKTFEVPNAKTLSISFQSFKKLLDPFEELSELEKAKLYRKVWNLGNGSVDIDSFMIIADEENLFLRTLRVKTGFEIPVKLDFEKNMKSDQGIYEELDLVLKRMEQYSDNIGFFEGEVEQLGCEEVMKDWIGVRRVIQGKLQVNSEEIKEKSLLEIIVKWMEGLLTGIKVFLMNNSKEIEDNREGFYDQEKGVIIGVFKDFLELVGGTEKIRVWFEEKRKLRVVEMNQKARKLQEFSKKKLSKWYTLLNSLLGPKAKKGGSSKKKGLI